MHGRKELEQQAYLAYLNENGVSVKNKEFETLYDFLAARGFKADNELFCKLYQVFSANLEGENTLRYAALDVMIKRKLLEKDTLVIFDYDTQFLIGLNKQQLIRSDSQRFILRLLKSFNPQEKPRFLFINEWEGAQQAVVNDFESKIKLLLPLFINDLLEQGIMTVDLIRFISNVADESSDTRKGLLVANIKDIVTKLKAKLPTLKLVDTDYSNLLNLCIVTNRRTHRRNLYRC